MRKERWWWVWSLAGTVATGAYFLLPRSGLAASVTYNVIGVCSAVAMVVGARMYRPERARMWYLFAVGQFVWVAGDITYEIYQFVLHLEPYPSIADAFYLSAYPLLMAGLVVLVRGRSSRDAAGLIDAAIIATGVGLVFWVFVMHPIAADTAMPALERVIGLAYPLADVLLLAMLARMFTIGGAQTASFRLLTVAVLLLLVADVGFSVVTSYSDYDGGVLDAGWLLSYVAWGAAALHPSMRTLGNTRVQRRTARVGRGRLVLLAGCSLLAPGVQLVQGFTAPEALDWLAVAVGAVVLFLLVVVRMSGFVRTVQDQAGQLEQLAMQDDLTGLANRRLLEDRLRAALRDGRPQVALVDLDEFKHVNDRLGHAVGDQLLIEVGRRLAAVLEPGDLVARMGGDEFAILLTDAGPEAATGIIECVVAALQQPVRVGGHHLLVQASIGTADGAGVHDPFEMLRRADVAMYAAKESGERHRWYVAELDDQATELARLGAELREALDEGQFQVVYQPIVTLPYGEIVAVEALVRWHRPDGVIIGPDTFIPVTEHNGLIVELGAWILRTACGQFVTWRATLGDVAPGRISVNVSARQLAEPGFAATVAAVLRETGLPASCLTVEVTETAVFGGGRALEALEDIRLLGVRIALDDFGTGHSSLGLLQTVPVDVLKVDKSFVDDITAGGRQSVIATALINVSDGLGLTAVAEGVETAEQARELYRLGYRLAQGYYFGRPTASPDFGAVARSVVIAT